MKEQEIFNKELQKRLDDYLVRYNARLRVMILSFLMLRAAISCLPIRRWILRQR